jgi:hypothetical protein
MGRKSYRREDALRYPFRIEAHDTGFRCPFLFRGSGEEPGLKTWG